MTHDFSYTPRNGNGQGRTGHGDPQDTPQYGDVPISSNERTARRHAVRRRSFVAGGDALGANRGRPDGIVTIAGCAAEAECMEPYRQRSGACDGYRGATGNGWPAAAGARLAGRSCPV